MTNPQQRGLALEEELNDLFKIDGLSVRDAFTIKDENGRIQEQIDGLIAWTASRSWLRPSGNNVPIGQGEISRHLVRVYGRAGVLGLFVSSSPIPIRQLPNARTCSASGSSCWPR